MLLSVPVVLTTEEPATAESSLKKTLLDPYLQEVLAPAALWSNRPAGASGSARAGRVKGVSTGTTQEWPGACREVPLSWQVPAPLQAGATVVSIESRHLCVIQFHPHKNRNWGLCSHPSLQKEKLRLRQFKQVAIVQAKAICPHRLPQTTRLLPLERGVKIGSR